MREHNEYWTGLLTAMSDGNPTGYQSLKATDVQEFYYLYRAHVKRMEQLNNAGKKKR